MRSSGLRCVLAAEHQTAEQSSKTGKTKPLKHLPRSSLSWNTCQDFLKIPTKPLGSCSGRASFLSSHWEGIYKNIPGSGSTKLTLGFWVGFITTHLTVDKLFPVNPRAITGPPKMSLLLEAKSMPALIIKPRLIKPRLVAHTDDLGWNKTSNQQQQMLIQNLNKIISRPNVTPG